MIIELLTALSLLPVACFSFLKLTDYSWVIILLYSLILLLFIGLNSKSDNVKIFFYNLAAICFALFLYETSLFLRQPKTEFQQKIEGKKHISEHLYLGYGNTIDGSFINKKYINNELIYDVTYHFRNGLRTIINSNDTSRNYIMFFGGSITFGEGLNDTLTLPYFINLYAGNNYNILNYAFSGYGPHQMLANIEHRVNQDIKDFSGEKIAVYTYLPYDHVMRAAGYTSWDRHGPKYEFISGDLKFVGPISRLPDGIHYILSQSYTFKKFAFQRTPNKKDLIRAIEIIKKSNHLLSLMDVDFIILVRGKFQSEEDKKLFLSEMRKASISVTFIPEAIPDFYDNKLNYSIHKFDNHPNGLANSIIAKYLFENYINN